MKAAVLVWLVTLCGRALAALSCLPPTIGAFNFSVPSGSYAIPRNAPVGTRITPFTSFQTTFPNVWTCSETSSLFVGPAYKSALIPAGVTYTEAGNTYQVFQTNVAGVGLVMQIGSYIPVSSGGNAWWAQCGLDTANWRTCGTFSSSAGFTNHSFGSGMAFAFVKTGPITPGTVSLPGSIAQIGMVQRYTSPYDTSAPIHVLPVTVTGTPTFTVLACSTPNVTVNLGTHMKSEFGGPNSYTSSVNFNLALNNCPTGMTSIRYQVDAVTPVVNPANSVVSLDGSSTATGVGVQLLDGSGNPFPLGASQTLSGYNSGTGGSYTIPFRARYYQTGTTVGPGTANTVLTFTMTYL